MTDLRYSAFGALLIFRKLPEIDLMKPIQITYERQITEYSKIGKRKKLGGKGWINDVLLPSSEQHLGGRAAHLMWGFKLYKVFCFPLQDVTRTFDRYEQIFLQLIFNSDFPAIVIQFRD